MCGIMGVVGSQHAWPVIVAGLKRLEYRGYDSAGIATWFDNKVHLARAVGPLHRLEARFPEGLGGTVGVGHTRWATHGVVSLENCHPHQDRQQTLAIAHNGIIDNAEHLRAQLGLDGFRSQTDTEVLAELIASVYSGDLLQAVRQAMNQIQGTAAVVVVHQDHPDQTKRVIRENASPFSEIALRVHRQLCQPCSTQLPNQILGTSTVRIISVNRSSTLCCSTSASAVKITRCRRTGRAICTTSSGTA